MSTDWPKPGEWKMEVPPRTQDDGHRHYFLPVSMGVRIPGQPTLLQCAICNMPKPGPVEYGP